MKQLKFRVWDKNNRNFLKDFSISKYGKLLTFALHGCDENCYCQPPNEQDFEIQQFTGIKDKNGREVYEGDIVRAGDVKESFRVTFGMAQYYLVNEDDVSAMDAFEFIGDYTENQKLLQVEIVGNIFELDKS